MVRKLSVRMFRAFTMYGILLFDVKTLNLFLGVIGQNLQTMIFFLFSQKIVPYLP